MVCSGVQRLPRGYRLALAGAADGCAYPKCGVVSTWVHSRYQRRVRDLPVQGRRVIARLQARKFFCDNRACERRISCERFAPAIAPYARRTARFEAALTTLALSCSAMTAARLGAALGIPGSASTLLRCAHRYQPPTTCTSGAISVDDFAFARGRRYGTIIVDLHTRRPIELLNERSINCLRHYLEAHPEVHTIARDRDPRYAETIAWAAPNATVIVDRWHLLRNLADAFERLVAQSSRAWREELQTQLDGEADSLARARSETKGAGFRSLAPLPHRSKRISTMSPRQELRRRAHLDRRQHLLDQAHALARAGLYKGAIAERLGIDRATVNTYLSRDTPPDHSRRAPTPSPIDSHYQYLAMRCRDGCRNAAQLTRELRQHGYTGAAAAPSCATSNSGATTTETSRSPAAHQGPPSPSPAPARSPGSCSASSPTPPPAPS